MSLAVTSMFFKKGLEEGFGCVYFPIKGRFCWDVWGGKTRSRFAHCYHRQHVANIARWIPPKLCTCLEITSFSKLAPHL